MSTSRMEAFSDGVLYGFVLILCAIAYFILQGTILRYHKDNLAFKKAIGKDLKGKASLILISADLYLPFIMFGLPLLLSGRGDQLDHPGPADS